MSKVTPFDLYGLCVMNTEGPVGCQISGDEAALYALRDLIDAALESPTGMAIAHASINEDVDEATGEPYSEISSVIVRNDDKLRQVAKFENEVGRATRGWYDDEKQSEPKVKKAEKSEPKRKKNARRDFQEKARNSSR